MSKSLRLAATGAIAWCIANTKRSRDEPPTSFRSSIVVAGSTMSACFAVAVHQLSCTTTVSGFCHAWRSRLRSWWWWNGLPPAQ